MSFLQEFSKIVILRDTPETRNIFGRPIDENAIKSANLSARDNTNPFYKRLVGSNEDGYFGQGWRESYPDLDTPLTTAPDPAENTINGVVSRAIRNNILQAMTNEEEGMTNGYNKLPKSAGTAIIVGNKLYFGGLTAGWTYDTATTFTIPTPALVAGDFIFWGDDPNSLKIGGRIKTVYTSGTDFDAGARYEFEKATAEATGTVGDPVNIYYYRKGWNGKDIKNFEQINPNSEIGGGFYVLIKLEGPNNNRIFPYLGYAAARNGDNGPNNNSNGLNPRIVKYDSTNPTKLYAFTDLIRIRRISNNFAADQTDTGVSEEIIPCSIHRTNNFYYNAATDIQNGELVKLHGNTNGATSPPNGGFTGWCAYYVNPYGGDAGRLDKNTTYVLEVNERLPAGNFSDGLGLFQFAASSDI
jgi:hypothetical protein